MLVILILFLCLEERSRECGFSSWASRRGPCAKLFQTGPSGWWHLLGKCEAPRLALRQWLLWDNGAACYIANPIPWDPMGPYVAIPWDPKCWFQLKKWQLHAGLALS